ncbi:MAG: hypothetical protein R2849_19135 [Thermomicrobiales bacterium]
MNTGHESFADTKRVSDAIIDAIRHSEHPIVITHARVDADAVGSAVGLAALCAHAGTGCRSGPAGDFRVSKSLDFLDPDGLLSDRISIRSGTPTS